MYCGYSYLRDTFRTTALSLSNEAVVNSGVNKLVRADSHLFVPPRMAPDKNDLMAHLVFALKHEGITSRFFLRCCRSWIPHFCNSL